MPVAAQFIAPTMRVTGLDRFLSACSQACRSSPIPTVTPVRSAPLWSYVGSGKSAVVGVWHSLGLASGAIFPSSAAATARCRGSPQNEPRGSQVSLGASGTPLALAFARVCPPVHPARVAIVERDPA